MKTERSKGNAPIYAIVRDGQVVAGPYVTSEEVVTDEGEEIIEILPTDEGYAEFKSFLG